MHSYILKSILVTVFTLFLSGNSKLNAQTRWEPDLSLTFDAFKTEALTAKDEVWVLDFWASWCRPCIASIPHLQDLYGQFGDLKVRFISLSWDEDKESWAAAVNRFKMEWNMILVPLENEASVEWLESSFPHEGIPTAFVIYRSGKVKRVNDVYALEKQINKALKKPAQ